MKHTEKLGLVKAEQNDKFSFETLINPNWDKIDAAMSAIVKDEPGGVLGLDAYSYASSSYIYDHIGGRPLNDTIDEIDAFKEATTKQIDGYVSITKFLITGELDPITKAYERACAYLIPLGGGEIVFPSGDYKLNINAYSGIIVTGKSAGKLLSAAIGGTVFSSFDPSKPTISIKGVGTTKVQGFRVRSVTLDANKTASSLDGIYIAGAHHITIDDVHVLNYNRYNINVENIPNLDTYFITFNNCVSYNAGVSNIRAVWDKSITSSWCTAVYCNDFISYTLPAKSAEGRIAYIGMELAVSGWLEAAGENFIVIDKDINEAACLVGRGALVDGVTGVTVIKLKDTLNRFMISSFFKGELAIDGNVRASDGTISGPTSFGSFPFSPHMYNPKVYNYLTFNNQESKNYEGKDKTRVFSSYDILRIDSTRPDSKGLELANTYMNPLMLTNVMGGGGIRLWYDNGLIRWKLSNPTSATDGSMLTMPTSVPPTKTSPGVRGQIAGDTNFFYYCYSDNNWIRVAKDTAW